MSAALSEGLCPQVLAQVEQIQALRHALHAFPELGYDVHRTADLVAQQLASWGLALTRGIGGTGLVGTLRLGGGRKAIGLRADMDALPIQETNDFAHRSTVPGAMHACGHDGHMAMVLGAARYLSLHGGFDGTVHFIFQPAEEGGAGARAMIQDGLFERFPVDAVFGVHNWPGLPAGHFGFRPGPLMASSVRFKITLEGRACHAAMPQGGRDCLFAATQLVAALQSIITRNKRPIDSAVLSVTQIHAGASDGVVPGEAWLGGTVRTFDESTTDLIEARMRDISSAVASAYECRATVEFVRNYPPTINDREQTAFAVKAAERAVGKECVDADIEPTMASEDFSFMLHARPGCYAFIGNGDGTHRPPGHGAGPCELHNDSYDFNDALIPVGTQYFINLVRGFLPQAP